MEKILNIPSMNIFNYSWDLLLKFMENEGNPPFSMGSSINITNRNITTLGNLVSVDGDINGEYNSKLESLGGLKYVTGNLSLYGCTGLKTLGNLFRVEKRLNLGDCYNLKSLGNLEYNITSFI